MNRKIINELNETILNGELRKRGIPEEYQFGICEREETEYSKVYGKTTFTYWNLALYKINGAFGERVQQIYGEVITDNYYTGTTKILDATVNSIRQGSFDRYKPFTCFEDNLASTECMNILYGITYGKEVK